MRLARAGRGRRLPRRRHHAQALDDVPESAIELAIQQSAEILPVVHKTDELEQLGGIGALLRF